MTLQNIENNGNVTSIEQEPAQETNKASGQSFRDDMTATYSPEDNKLRVTSVHRLDGETWGRLKAAGFIWAPKQQLFVAPMWTPAREDLLLELVGEIGDEDSSLVDRAEERAERFGEYSEKRAKEAKRARDGVAAITDGIPLGQPILIGHHSQRRAERDAERIENGMRKAVNLWHTSQYWKSRAAGALRLAKYKERADVRHRRIKKLEADKRKHERTVKEAETIRANWARVDSQEKAVHLAGYSSSITVSDGSPYGTTLYSLLIAEKITHEEAVQKANSTAEAMIAWATRWIDHLSMRITYERAMLGETGTVKAASFDIQPGGMVLIAGEWVTVVRVTRKNGEIVSVTTNARYVPRRGIEEVREYKAPTAEQAAKATAAGKLAPLANYPGEGFQHMTKAEYEAVHTCYRHIRKVAATPDAGAHRVRVAMLSGCRLVRVFLTDVKRVDPPAGADSLPSPADLPAERVIRAHKPKPQSEDDQSFTAMKDALRSGTPVQVVTAPQLFPTPAALAQRMVQLAELGLSDSVLEPSAGTGAILDAIDGARCRPAYVTAVEINPQLCQRLRARDQIHSGGPLRVVEGDFLEQTPETIGSHFDRVLMNPPFSNAVDVKHVKHALRFVRPGGRLVAIVAGGPRQAEQLRELAEESGGVWEPLPEGTFANAGTNVRTVLVMIRA